MERARRFVANRLSTDTYLGLHLTLSFLIAAAAIWVSSALLDGVLDNATLVRLDVALATWIHGHITPTGTRVCQIISQVGSPTSMGVVAVVGGLFLLTQRRGTVFVAWIAAFAAGGALERVMKMLVHRTRPRFTPTPPTEQSLSFPSGHAMMSLIGMSMLVYVLLVPRRIHAPWRGILFGVALAAVLLVGISRVYLGAHYPSDVLGGWAAGAGWVAICVGVRGLVSHGRRRARSRRGATKPTTT